MVAEAIAIGSAVISALLATIMGLAQAHWRATIAQLDERFAYERAKLDHLVTERHADSLQMAKLEASNNGLSRRSESIEEDLGLFRRELIHFGQTLTRIETLLRRSTPPPKGG